MMSEFVWVFSSFFFLDSARIALFSLRHSAKDTDLVLGLWRNDLRYERLKIECSYSLQHAVVDCKDYTGFLATTRKKTVLMAGVKRSRNHQHPKVNT